MSYGLQTFFNGRAILTPDGAGGVFHSFVVFENHTDYQRFTFTDIPGASIFCFTALSGGHNWYTGNDGNGYPYVEAPPMPLPEWQGAPSAEYYKTTLGVFVK